MEMMMKTIVMIKIIDIEMENKVIMAATKKDKNINNFSKER